MTFEAPLYLLGLLVVPLGIAAYLLAQRRRWRTAARFASPHLLPNVIDRSPGWRRHVPATILLLGLGALLVGVARPHAAVSVPREEATIVLAIDTSRSMAATDVEPSRLAAARAAVTAFLEKVPEKYGVGVVAFASAAQVVAPPTHDRGAVRSALASLRSGEGTAIGDAIVRAIAVGRSVRRTASDRPHDEEPPPVSVLLVSDGAHEGGRVEPADAAKRAASLEIPVYTVALGTEEGIVEVRRVGGFVERIRVPPAPEALAEISRATGGRSFAIEDADELEAVYEDLGSRLGRTRKKEEITFAFAAGGAGLLLTGGLLSALWFRRVP